MIKRTLFIAALVLTAATTAHSRPRHEGPTVFVGINWTYTEAQMPPIVAQCAASGSSRLTDAKWDNVGFTVDDAKSSNIFRYRGAYSPTDPTQVDKIIETRATARRPLPPSADVEWKDILIRCGVKRNAIVATEIWFGKTRN